MLSKESVDLGNFVVAWSGIMSWVQYEYAS